MLKKNDFIEIEFTGQTKEGDIFDSNIKEDIALAGLKVEAKPFTFCLGQGMFLKGIDDFLIGKDLGEHKAELKPEDAFGKREPSLVQMVPLKIFAQHKTQPVPGAVFQFDGRIAKVLTVSGGRVMVDFNSPLAGKDVTYKIKVLKKLAKPEDKVKALNEFLFRKDFKFEIKNKKLILEVGSQMKQFVEMFADKFKEILGLNLEVKGLEDKEKKEEEKHKQGDKKDLGKRVKENNNDKPSRKDS